MLTYFSTERKCYKVPLRNALQNRSASKRVCKLPQNSSVPVCALVPGAPIITEYIQKYILKTQHVLPELTTATTTNWFTVASLKETLLVLLRWSPELFQQSCGSNILEGPPMMHKMAWNRSTLDSVLGPGASNRDPTVRQFAVPFTVNESIFSLLG